MIKNLKEDYREVLGGEHSLPLGVYLIFAASKSLPINKSVAFSFLFIF